MTLIDSTNEHARHPTQSQEHSIDKSTINSSSNTPQDDVYIPTQEKENMINDLIHSAMSLHRPLTPQESIELSKGVQDLLPKCSYTHDENGLKMDLNKTPDERFVGDNTIQCGDSWPYPIRYLYGVLIIINFLIFWAIPHGLQSIIWDIGFSKIGGPVSSYLNNNKAIQSFAKKYIYQNERNSDLFVQSCLTLLNFTLAFTWILHCQLTQTDGITLFQIGFYYWWMIGFRGGGIAGTFAIMHHEGHNTKLYRPFIRNTFGNIFETSLSAVYGTVPMNASISHTWLHHALQGRSGDSFYQCDLNRAKWGDLFVFLHRIGLHQAGITSLLQLHRFGLTKQRNQFAIQGILRYFIMYPSILLMITKSWWFFFWIYIQPHLMTVFLSAWVNMAFHAFIDYQEDGTPAECCCASEYTNSSIDWHGEDRHLSHHIVGHIHPDDQDSNRMRLKTYFGHYHASVFTNLGSLQATGLILGHQWDVLASHFVQYNDEPSPHKPPEDELIARAYFEAKYLSNTTKPSVFIGMGKLSLREIAVMLELRAQRREPKWLRGSWINIEKSTMPFVHQDDHNHTDHKLQFD